MRQVRFGIFGSLLLSATLLADAHAPAETPAGPTGEQAYRQLIEGHARYANNVRTLPRQNEQRRCETTTGGQHPVAAVLSCADSRVPPEMLFDQGIGDLFVIRVAGNVAATDELGTLEYGVEHLNIPLIVVLGHTRCGAVTAVVDGAHAEGNLAQLLQPIVPAAERTKHDHPDLRGPALVGSAIQENVRQALNDLTARSPVIAKAVRDNRVKLVGGVYDIHAGRIDWIDRSSLAATTDAPRPAATSHDSHATPTDTHTAPADAHAAAPRAAVSRVLPVAIAHDDHDDHASVKPVTAPARRVERTGHKPAVPAGQHDPHADADAATPVAAGASDDHDDAHAAPAAGQQAKPKAKPKTNAADDDSHAASKPPVAATAGTTLVDQWPILTGAVIASTLIGAGVTHIASRNKA